MDTNTQSPLNSKSNLLKILDFIPHSNIPSLATINVLFNRTIQDFQLFHGYTLTFDCGRRGSIQLGKASKGFVDNKGRLTTTKNPEIIINDYKKIILICTSNRPLKSSATKDALIAISSSSINKLHFKSFRITQQLISSISAPSSAPSSARSSPWELDSVSQFVNPRPSTKLPCIQEQSNSRRSRPPPAPSTGSSRITPASRLSPLPMSNTYSNSSTLSNFMTSDIMDLPLLSSIRLSNSLSLKRMSAAILGGDDYRDYNFESLLEILNKAPFDSLIIGEECISWSWSNVMTTLQHFNNIQHLAVHIGFERRSMPSIKSEKKWLDFIGTHYLNIPLLRSLYCDDDAFLRCMTSLSLYRSLGKHLTFIEEPQYEKGSLLKNRLRSITTNTDDIEENATDILNGHYVKKSDVNELLALEYVRFRSQFAPEHNLSGREMEGAKVLEVSPYDSMFITIPRSTVSFRISSGSSFYEEPDDYTIVVPLTNNIRELCIYNISNLDRVDGLYHLKELEYLVIKKRPKNKEEFMKAMRRVCKYAPIKQITLMPLSRKKHMHAARDYRSDYWQNLGKISVKYVKERMDIADHPTVIVIKHSYNVPKDVPQIADCSRFSDYKS